ncbi:hypothetical protein OIDMADRAFT_35039 [Oidiodendron maius Zn]|uniref:F-box domain-containing protein n=1 Tax=Oidiodendron maius (strain Zn) TaxID=913774 RepID=A0A0C3C6I0_OIDMZ|nr:hypothetical protein OIDMADRAFT_35039 [Oidiodendron maius Zn]
MSCFESLLRLAGLRHFLHFIAEHIPGIVSRPIALEVSLLGQLPLELILYMVQFFPPVSRLSFSLCCRPIYFALGTQHLKDITEEDRHVFLTLLEPKLPDYILCYSCKKFHAISNARKHIKLRYLEWAGRRLLPCQNNDIKIYVPYYFHDKFSFTVFQMTMKLYRQGLDYSKLLNILSAKTTTTPGLGYVVQCLSSAQIIGGSLFYRRQKIYLMPPNYPVPKFLDHPDFICRHWSPRPKNPQVEAFRDVIENRAWNKIKDLRKLEKLKSCLYCHSEYRYDFAHLGKKGNAVFITQWRNLGEGRSPMDPQWLKHTHYFSHFNREPVCYTPGSIYAKFESEEHFEFDYNAVSTPQDRKALFSMYYWGLNGESVNYY